MKTFPVALASVVVVLTLAWSVERGAEGPGRPPAARAGSRPVLRAEWTSAALPQVGSLPTPASSMARDAEEERPTQGGEPRRGTVDRLGEADGLISYRVTLCGLETEMNVRGGVAPLGGRASLAACEPGEVVRLAAAEGVEGELDVALVYDAAGDRLVWEVTSPMQPEDGAARVARLSGLRVGVETGEILSRARIVYDGAPGRHRVAWK